MQSTENSSADSQALTVTHSTSAAQDWHLSDKEWIRYQTLMQGSSGLWYKTLNPTEVLGLNARDKTERAHFAKLVAEERYQRVTQELQFQQAMNQVWIKLYPNLPAIQTFDTAQFAKAKGAQP